MVLTDEIANVKKILVQTVFLLDSGISWGSHNLFRISAQSLSTSINLMQRGEGESLGRKKKKKKEKKINSKHLSACRPQAKTDWVPKSRQREIPDFTVQFFGAAPVMWLIDLSFWITVFYSCVQSLLLRLKLWCVAEALDEVRHDVLSWSNYS